MYYKDTIELDGMQFAVYLERDDCTLEPWREHDCHGPVSEWTSRNKQPDELVLDEDRGSKRFYDFQEACRIARRDGWGYMPFPVNKAMTARKYSSLAARADYERLRAWCQGDWCFAVVQVRLLDEFGDVIAESSYLGGVESDGWQYCAEELARELISECQAMARAA